jgi:hypothetical protein
MSWRDLEEGNPELAAFGLARLQRRPAYMATLRPDGSPRLHPMTPILAPGRLFVFMEPTSPKGRDLERDGRCTIHCTVTDTSGASGEFYVSGVGRRVTDAESRAVATQAAPYNPADRYILFEFAVTQAGASEYGADGPRHMRWKRAA